MAFITLGQKYNMNEDACAIRTRAFKVNEQLVQSDGVASEKYMGNYGAHNLLSGC